MSFSEGQSLLISRRIGSDRAFLPSKKLSRLRTARRCCDEPFLLFALIPIAFGCFCQGMPKLLFRRRLRVSPLRLRLLPLLQMLLLWPLLGLLVPPIMSLCLLLAGSARRNLNQGWIHVLITVYLVHVDGNYRQSIYP
jgi:hypothetical protein